MPQTSTTASQVYRISELDIDSVGIVMRGAVSADAEPTGKNFIMFKSVQEEVEMPDELTIEEVPEQDTEPTDEGEVTEEPNWLEKAKQYTDSLFAKRQEEDEPEEEEEEEEIPVGATTNDTVAAVVKAQTEAIFDKQLERVKGELEKQYEKRLTELQERVEKAEEREQEAVEKRQQREWLEKAMDYQSLPVSRTELGEKLYALAKAAPDDIEWWEATLQAVAKQLFAAGVFNEMGTSKVPEQVELEEKVVKAQAEGNPREALLSLSEDEQTRLLEQSRGGV